MSQQLHTQDSLSGRPISALVDASIADEENIVGILDEAIPLQGARHADVVEYVVESPMRYAECCALLSDGRKVGLRDPRKFVGWSQHSRNRSLLFRSDGKHFEIAVEKGLRGQDPGSIRVVFLEASSERRSGIARKFFGIDGELITLPV